MEWNEQLPMDLRRDVFLAASSQRFAHMASSYSCVEILCALYFLGGLRYDPRNPMWDGRDYLILSKGHGGLALYAALCRAGFFDRETLMRFCVPGCLLGAEPHPSIPGVEACGGSLGHGLPYGVGITLAMKMDGKPNRTYVIMGDGEAQEGSVWEAAMAAAKFQLANLTVILDANGVQKMDTVQAVMGISSWAERFQAFGWNVREVAGHDAPGIARALLEDEPVAHPRLLIAHTVKGKGVSVMENDPSWHFRMPNRREKKRFLEELSLTEEAVERAKSIRDGAV